MCSLADNIDPMLFFSQGIDEWKRKGIKIALVENK
jgi:hypothetical protein